MTIYYFTPNYAKGVTCIRRYKKEDCKREFRDTLDVYRYTELKNFEKAFNDGFISDEGYIRTFED